MTGRGRATNLWGARRVTPLEAQVQTFTSTVHKLGTRVSGLADVDPELALDPHALREALDVLRLEYDALLVAEEELRTQLADLQENDALIAQQRRRYEELFLFAPDGYAITDELGIVEEANGAMTRLVGIESRFFVGKPLASYVDGPDVARFRGHLAKLPDNAGEELLLRMRPRQSSLIPVSIVASALPRPRREIFWRFRRNGPPIETSPAAPPLADVRVLLVDTDVGTREMHARVLRDRGALVVTADDDSAAFAAELEPAYDVLIVACAADAERAAAVLRKARTHTHAVALAICDASDVQTVTSVLAAGFDAHLPAPLTASQLVDVTQAAARRARR